MKAKIWIFNFPRN